MVLLIHSFVESPNPPPQLLGVCVIMQEFAYFLCVMPDPIRHPAAGRFENQYIPNQVSPPLTGGDLGEGVPIFINSCTKHGFRVKPGMTKNRMMCRFDNYVTASSVLSLKNVAKYV